MPGFRKYYTYSSAIALLLCHALPSAVSAQPVRIVDAPFIEEFERLSPALWYISDGWRNGAHQNCTWSKRALSKAKEGISLNFVPSVRGADNAVCGEIQTKTWFQYGTFEARFSASAGSGKNAAFFAYTGAIHEQPHDEIDFEILTKKEGLVWTNRFVSGDDKDDGATTIIEDGSGFHDYAFIWEPDRLRWYVDGELIREETTHIPSHRMKVYFSHWGTDTLTRWMGKFDNPDGPAPMVVSRFMYTPLGAECAFEESILCELP